MLWTYDHVDTTGSHALVATGAGYGYSIGAGFGYETGTGLRVDGTVDYLSNDGLTDGTNVLHLRSTVALANVYYDFPLRAGARREGGFGAYVGGGLGAAYNQNSIDPGQRRASRWRQLDGRGRRDGGRHLRHAAPWWPISATA